MRARRTRSGIYGSADAARRVAVARARKPAPPWAGLDDTWYAALESQGTTYGLARRVPGPDGTAYEMLDRATGSWIPAPSATAAGWFTEIGGVTDAVPITSDRASELESELMKGGSS